jgi:hypothetical protein
MPTTAARQRLSTVVVTSRSVVISASMSSIAATMETLLVFCWKRSRTVVLTTSTLNNVVESKALSIGLSVATSRMCSVKKSAAKMVPTFP